MTTAHKNDSRCIRAWITYDLAHSAHATALLAAVVHFAAEVVG